MASTAYSMSGLPDMPEIRIDFSEPVHIVSADTLSDFQLPARLTKIDIPDVVDT